MKFQNKVVSVFDHKTSLRLTEAEWRILDSICHREYVRRRQVLELLATIKNPILGLTGSVRLFVMIYLDRQVHGLLPEPKIGSKPDQKTLRERLAQIFDQLL
jgi:predicted DNA-binding ribbon-helix-helix protein